MRALVAYPLALFYVGFGIMGIFSSRGTGNLAKVTTGTAGAAAAGSGVFGKSGGGGGAFGRFAGGGGARRF